MSKQLATQLKNSDEIKNVLKEVEFTHKLPNGMVVQTLLVYLPIASGKSSHKEFFEIIKNGILANFIFSCTEVEKKLGITSATSKEDLFDKSIRKLSKHTSKGELGELILFTLLDVYLQAPKLLSKISMKTSPTMPVFGADGVHGQFYNGKFRVYLGESKLHKNFMSAATHAAISLKNARSSYGNEYDLLDTYLDFPGIDEQTKNHLLEILDPFSGVDMNGMIHSSCFIGFNGSDLIKNESNFIDDYKNLAKNHIDNFMGKVSKQGVDIDEVVLIMLPFTCVNTLVKEFISYMGITK